MRCSPLSRLLAAIAVTVLAVATGVTIGPGLVAPVPYPVPEPNPGALIAQSDRFWLWLAAQAVVFGVLLVLLWGGFSARLARGCEQWLGGRRLLGASILTAALVAVLSLALIPVGLFELIREEAWGLQPQGVMPWLRDEVIGLLTLSVVAAVFGWVPILVIRKFPRTWWVWSSATLVVVGGAYLLVRPAWIDPLTTTYVAVEDPEWQARIDQLASRAGVADLPVLIWRTSPNDFCRIQNGVIGLGPTRTVILADQIFTEWDAAEIDAAIAHELKHYLFDNTWLVVLILGGFATGGSLTIYLLGGAVLRRWANRLGFKSLADPAAVPLFVVCLQLFLVVAIPAFHLTAQYAELEAVGLGIHAL